MFTSIFSSRSRGSWIPPIDIIDQDSNFTMIMDLPEVKKEDLKVYTERSNIVCISGNRYRSKQDEDLKDLLIVAERGYGRFERCFELPTSIDDSSVKASFRNQILRVVVPKEASKDVNPSASIKIE
ncbi:unnamed protein product [Phytomonas sp. Hart1]|eukprot:CCW67287.1 unnamed protein product [Phytomonas sp. isolate Hart1]